MKALTEKKTCPCQSLIRNLHYKSIYVDFISSPCPLPPADMKLES